jgi:hypothetical protein
MSECLCGCGGQPTRGRYLQGHQWTDPEIREKRAAKLRGRPLTDEHRAALSEARSGVVFSEERRKNIAEARIRGWDAPLYVVEDRGFATPCWVWARARYKTGYGALRRGGKSLRAHRWMYEQMVGPIPTGKHLDHLCCVRECVNPSHLEPVTKRENELRAVQRRRQ